MKRFYDPLGDRRHSIFGILFVASTSPARSPESGPRVLQSCFGLLERRDRAYGRRSSRQNQWHHQV